MKQSGRQSKKRKYKGIAFEEEKRGEFKTRNVNNDVQNNKTYLKRKHINIRVCVASSILAPNT